MADPEISERMREDWNARAREDAGYYVACNRRYQSDAEFYASATEIVNGFEAELLRVPVAQRGAWKALEVGCGPGRLMRPMSRHFAEIHGVDVSNEMIGLARESLRDIPNAHVHLTDGASLREFPDESYDFIYSYAVFQHIPSREVIREYLTEIHRTLKTGGFARLWFDGLSRQRDSDTWTGAPFSSTEILEFTQFHGIQVLALEGASTPYLRTSWRKQPPGWFGAQMDRSFTEYPAHIRRVANLHSTEPGAPSRGRYASISIGVENLPPEANLHVLRVGVGDSLGTVTHIGPVPMDGVQQISVLLPELEATGLLPLELRWIEERIAPPTTLRVIPPGPAVPRICSVTDGVNLGTAKRIETGHVKMIVEEVALPHEIEATIGGLPVGDLEFLCLDPRPQRFEISFRVPEEIAPGPHDLQVRVGRRKLAPVSLEIVAAG